MLLVQCDLGQRRRLPGTQILLLCACGRLLFLPMACVQGLMDVWALYREKGGHPFESLGDPLWAPGAWQMLGCGPCASRILPSCHFQSVVRVWGRGGSELSAQLGTGRGCPVGCGGTTRAA